MQQYDNAWCNAGGGKVKYNLLSIMKSFLTSYLDIEYGYGHMFSESLWIRTK